MVLWKNQQNGHISAESKQKAKSESTDRGSGMHIQELFRNKWLIVFKIWIK